MAQIGVGPKWSWPKVESGPCLWHLGYVETGESLGSLQPEGSGVDEGRIVLPSCDSGTCWVETRAIMPGFSCSWQVESSFCPWMKSCIQTMWTPHLPLSIQTCPASIYIVWLPMAVCNQINFWFFCHQKFNSEQLIFYFFPSISIY